MIYYDEDAIDHNDAMVWKCLPYYLPFVTDKFFLCHNNLKQKCSVIGIWFYLIID